MLVDETGKIEFCMVTEASGQAILDARACSILRMRARFDPTLGIDGKPVKSGTTGRIKWSDAMTGA